jgi:hypothetical protein
VRGSEVIVYNPNGNRDFIQPDPRTGRVSATAEHSTRAAFAEAVKHAIARRNGKPIYLTIDEATTYFRKVNCPEAWMATRGRHAGLNLTIICQHYAELNTVVRGQCERLYLFGCGLTTADRCADEFGLAELKQAPRLPKGHYLRAEIGSLTPGRVF